MGPFVAALGACSDDAGDSATADAGSATSQGDSNAVSDTVATSADVATSAGDVQHVGSDSKEVSCKCGDGLCNFAPGCEENYTSCAADCAKTCGDGACAPGENPSNCKVDCCGGCGDGLCKGYACGENSDNCAKDCGSACGDQVCGKGENPDTCPEDCKFKACGNQICEGGESPDTCPQDCGTACGNCKCESGEDWQSCPVDCAWCGDGVCSPCDLAKETVETCPFDCADKECYPKSPKPQIACSDGNPCTKDVCDKAGKCQYVDATAGLPTPPTCTDADVCTVGDHCSDKSCKAGPNKKPCDDGNPCTTDFCDPVDGCGAKATDGKPCDDGDACTGFDACLASSCKGFAKDCDDDNPCSKDTCNKEYGCVYVPLDATPCSDSDACTVNDLCKQGKCKSGSKANCDDNNVCTLDTCEANKGCSSVAKDGDACSDGNACTKNDACAGSACVGSPVSCDDSNVCTDDSCDKIDGCDHVANGDGCDDGDACTVKDKCAASKCVAGPAKDCSDSNVCTDDSCVNNSCQHKALSQSNVLCNDGLSCTVADLCKLGVCQGTSKYGLKVYSAVAAGNFDDAFTLLPRGNDGWWMFGRKQSQGLLKSWSITASKLDKSFKLLDTASYQGYENNHMHAAAVNSKGAMAVVGWQTGTPTKACLFGICKVVPCPDCSYDYMFMRFSAAGKPEAGGDPKKSSWQQPYSKHQAFHDVAAMPDDGFVVVGRTDGNKSMEPVIARIGPAPVSSFSPKCKAFFYQGNSSNNTVKDYYNAVAVQVKKSSFLGSSTYVYALGTSVYKGQFRGLLHRYSSSCKVSWQANLAQMPVGEGTKVFVRKDGVVQAFGHPVSQTQAQKHIWAVAVDSSGKLLWSQSYKNFVDAVDGGVVASGTAFVSSKSLVRLDAYGNVVWSSPTTGQVVNRGFGLDSEGAPVVLGGVGAPDVPDAVSASSGNSSLIRFGPWGYSSCGLAGNCADQALSKCDDKNPCTADGCGPAKCGKDITGAKVCSGAVCKNTSLVDGSPCATGKTCKAGTCQ